MDIKRRAVALWPAVPYQPLADTKAIRRKWLAAVAELGDKWILSAPVVRLTK